MDLCAAFLRQVSEGERAWQSEDALQEGEEEAVCGGGSEWFVREEVKGWAVAHSCALFYLLAAPQAVWPGNGERWRRVHGPRSEEPAPDFAHLVYRPARQAGVHLPRKIPAGEARLLLTRQRPMTEIARFLTAGQEYFVHALLFRACLSNRVRHLVIGTEGPAR